MQSLLINDLRKIMVPSPGFEPGLPASETGALSIELSQNQSFILIISYLRIPMDFALMNSDEIICTKLHLIWL